MVAAAEYVDFLLWNHTAQICAVLGNVHRDPEKRKEPFVIADCHPYHAPKHTPVRQGVPITAASVRAQVDAEIARRGARLTP